MIVTMTDAPCTVILNTISSYSSILIHNSENHALPLSLLLAYLVIVHI